jgi:uncharacterized protein YyaL (SSP411 family)
LLLATLSEAGRDLQRVDYTKAAEELATFLQTNLRSQSGRLLRTWREGSPAKYNGYLEDYAFLAEGLLCLYENTFEPGWFIWARELADLMIAHFLDEEGGGFFDTSDDHERLIHRPKDLQDNAIPSGNAIAALVMLRISLFTSENSYWDIGHRAVASMTEAMSRYPTGFAQWLCVADTVVANPKEVAIVGDLDADDTQALLAVVFSGYRPNLVVSAGRDGQNIPLLHARSMIGDRATAYICRRFVCDAPTVNPEALVGQLS